MQSFNQPLYWVQSLASNCAQRRGQYVELLTDHHHFYVAKFLDQTADQILYTQFQHEIVCYKALQPYKFCPQFQLIKELEIHHFKSKNELLLAHQVIIFPYYPVQLSQPLENSVSKSFKQKIEQMLEMSNTVYQLHQLGYVHGDLKSQHMVYQSIIGQAHILKLLDYAQMTHLHTLPSERLAQGDHIHQTNITATPAYMAPELFLGHAISIQSDIYALGIIFYQLWQGQKPFAAQNYRDWALAHCQTPVPLITQYTAPLQTTIQNVLDGMLAKNINNRFETLSEVIAHLNVIKNTYIDD